MDIHGLADGTEAVCGVYVTAMVLIEVQTPVALVFVPERLQVVDVSAGSVKHLSEETLLGHVEGGHDVAAGTSTATCLPISMANTAISTWFCQGVTM